MHTAQERSAEAFVTNTTELLAPAFHSRTCEGLSLPHGGKFAPEFPQENTHEASSTPIYHTGTEVERVSRGFPTSIACWSVRPLFSIPVCDSLFS